MCTHKTVILNPATCLGTLIMLKYNKFFSLSPALSFILHCRLNFKHKRNSAIFKLVNLIYFTRIIDSRYIRFPTNDQVYHFWESGLPLHVNTFYLFICWWVYRCFQYLAILSCAVKMGFMDYCDMLPLTLGEYLGQIDFLSSVFWGISMLIFAVIVPVYAPTKSEEGFFPP